MDTLFWIQCNPNLAIEHTTKKYFGKYLHKLVVYAPAGRLVDSKGPMEKELEHRKTVSKHINQGGWWGHRYNKDLDNADVDFLNTLRDIRHDRTLGIKLRVEEPMIQIYANSNQTLKDLVNKFFTKEQRSYVKSISGPENEQAEKLLDSGSILRKTDIGYKYKVLLRDGRYSPEVKTNLLNYLDSLGPEIVKLSGTNRSMLNRSNTFLWNMYFYTNDTSVVTFLNLICPGIVLNSHELVVLPNK